jgi:ribulose-phosphate 3-epimerase
MDGKFVENNTLDMMKKYSETLSNLTITPMEVHLMVEDVKKFVDEYEVINPNIIYFHIEACKNDDEVIELINYIKEKDIRVGITINPETDVEKLFPLLKYVHSVLIMSVHPGKGGQSFIADSLNKISTLKKQLEDNNLEVDINVDGGINAENIASIREAGATIATVGSAMVNAIDYKYMMNKLKNA